jgi:uncharacterized membrane protein YkgB
LLARLAATYDRLDRRITQALADWGITVLRVALGIVFLWFGVLKLIPGLSPAEGLAGKTIETLTLGVVQLLGTLTPLLLFPDEAWVRFPFVPTLEGQYIIKNLVLIAAAMVIGATVRGGRLIAEPSPQTVGVPVEDPTS